MKFNKYSPDILHFDKIDILAMATFELLIILPKEKSANTHSDAYSLKHFVHSWLLWQFHTGHSNMYHL